MEGEYFYKVSFFYCINFGKRGFVKVKREVIVFVGMFNIFQFLKLSGIGFVFEFLWFGIFIIKYFLGVGINMMDCYEIFVNVVYEDDFFVFDGCMFDFKFYDLCLKQWLDNFYIFVVRGVYVFNGLVVMMFKWFSFVFMLDIDFFIFGGLFNFQGYFFGWYDFFVCDYKYFFWYSFKVYM